MALEKKVLAGGGMDKDTDSRFLAKNDYREAHNVRISTSDEGNEGTVENIRSNLKIPNLDVDAQGNKVIGSYEDVDNKKVYYFVAGAAWTGGNSIYQYDTSTETVQLVLQDSLLNFDRNYLITGISIIGTDEDRFPLGLLYWTDDFNPPRKINIDKALRYTASGGGDPLGYQSITFDSLDAIKHPPEKEPTCQNLTVLNPFLTDTNTQNNQLKGRSWQFKYRWVYDDGEISSWSPNSLVHADTNFDSFFDSGTVSNVSNVLPVAFNSGEELVERIQIATRNSNDMDDWLLVCDIKKSYLKEKVGTSVSSISPLGTGTVLNNNNQYVFYFYNDGIYNTVDVVESAKLYNDVPHLAKAQEVVDGNRLVYGNVVTGQTADIEPDVSFTAGHPKETIITQPGVQTNLNWQISTIGRWTDKESPAFENAVRRKHHTTHRLRFEIEEICPGGIGQYNLTFTDFICNNTNTQNTHFFNDCRRQVGIAVCSGNYQSVPYSASFGTALDIAQDMAGDLNLQPPMHQVISGSHPGQMNNNDNFVITNWTSGWSAYAGIGNNAWLEFTVNSRSAESMKFGGQTWLGGGGPGQYTQSGSPGANLGNFTSTNPFAQESSQWNRMVDDGQAPHCRSYAFSGFPTGLGNTWTVSGNNVGGSGGFAINATGTNFDTPDVPIDCSGWTAAGNTSMGIAGLDAASSALALAVRARGLVGNPNAMICSSEIICPDQGGPGVPAVSSFKNGARHRFGIVYYDRALRSSSVQLASDSEIYIPRASEATASDPNGWAGEWYIDWEINHQAPEWAEYWQWVYGGNTLTDDYIQFVTDGIHDGTTCAFDIGQSNSREGTDFDKVIDDIGLKQKGAQQAGDYSQHYLVDMTNLNQYVMQEGGAPTVYNFEEGDMLRVVSDAADNPAVNESWEFKILGVVGQGRFPHIDWNSSIAGGCAWNLQGEYKDLLVLALESSLVTLFTAGTQTIMQDYTLEIYSPKRKTKEKFQIYNEFGHFANCTEINGVNCHMQVIEDLTSGSPAQSQDFNAGVPARGRFTRGDVFFRLRATKSNKLFTPLESFHFSDKYKSDYWDKGRPNAVLEDFRRTRKHSTVLYSEPYVPNTYINGLNSFFPDVSFQEFERSYNSIQYLHSKDNALIIFQEDKTSKALVKRDIIYNVDGSGNVATSDTVISQAVPYLGDYGICKNPESFASHGLRMYFVDIRRGCVLRLSQDGFTLISENNMKEYFTDLCESILGINRAIRYNIYGVWDKRFNEYIVAFQQHNTTPIVFPPGPTSVSSAKLKKAEEMINANSPEYLSKIFNVDETKIDLNVHLLNSPSARKKSVDYEVEERRKEKEEETNNNQSRGGSSSSSSNNNQSRGGSSSSSSTSQY